MRFNAAVAEMVGHLSSFLPPLTDPTPHTTLAVLEATDRPVGVGNWQGNVERGPLAQLGVRGGRVEARVRFDVRAADPADAASRALGLQAEIRAARLDATRPWMRSFLVLQPDGGESPQLLSDDEGWRQGVEFRALYEYRYEDPEGAGSVIVRVPVDVRGEHHEDDLVTRHVARWDREGAEPLRLRGPAAVAPLAVLSHPGDALPAGTVTLLRTHAAAEGPPADHATPDAFRLALEAGGRHDRLVFGSVAAFLAALQPAGDPVTLAAMDPDPVTGRPVPAAYASLAPGAGLGPALAAARLAGPGERFEVIYRNPALPPGAEQKYPPGSRAVTYLRAGRGLSA